MRAGRDSIGHVRCTVSRMRRSIVLVLAAAMIPVASSGCRSHGRDVPERAASLSVEVPSLPRPEQDAVGTTSTTSVELFVALDAGAVPPRARAVPGADRYSIIEAPRLLQNLGLRTADGGIPPEAPRTTSSAAAARAPEGDEPAREDVGPASAADRIPWAGDSYVSH